MLTVVIINMELTHLGLKAYKSYQVPLIHTYPNVLLYYMFHNYSFNFNFSTLSSKRNHEKNYFLT